MNAKYFKEQICEELEGACDYLKKAIDCMKHYPEWSKKFKSMSDAEEHHATELYKMFMDWYTNEENQDSHAQAMREGIMNCFSEYMRKLEDHRITYDMMVKEDAKQATPMKSPSMITNVTSI